jgi:hypothetical protein
MSQCLGQRSEAFLSGEVYRSRSRPHAEAAVSKLLRAGEDQLYEELGARAGAMAVDPAVAGSFEPQLAGQFKTRGALDDARELGRRLFRRWNREAYQLVCGGEAAAEEDRKELLESFGLGDVAVATALAGLLVSYLGLAPAVAVVVAALVTKRFFTPSYQEFCELWKEKLPKADSR